MGSKVIRHIFLRNVRLEVYNGVDTTEPREVSMENICGRTYLGILFPKHPLLASIVDSGLDKLHGLVFSVNPKLSATRPNGAF